MSLQTSKTRGEPAGATHAEGLVLRRTCACGKNTMHGGGCGACERRSGLLQRRSHGLGDERAGVPESVHEVLGSPGRPLDTETRSLFESRFGHDFSGVRVHTDERAAESAREVNAHAYTVGRNVVFGTGRYAPSTEGGRRLLAHELAHVVQQRPGLAAHGGLTVGHAGDPLEAEADRAAEAVVGGSYARVATSSAAQSVRRAVLDGPGGGGGPDEERSHGRERGHGHGGRTDYVADTELIKCMQYMGPDSREACLQQLGDNPQPTPCVKGFQRSVSLQPIFLRTSATDLAPTGTSWASRFAEGNRIWNKLGVTFTQLAPVTIDTPRKTNGSDRAETLAVAALRSAAGVEVFLVDNDMAWIGGAATAPAGAGSKTMMSDRGTSNTLLAHELGHVLGLFHPGDGTNNDGDANTVMQGTGSHSAANPTRNTMVNYRRLTWPAGTQLVCINPDI